MSSLDKETDIVRLASALGIHQHPTPAEAIVEYCLNKVKGWLDEFKGDSLVDSLSGVEKIVCAKLCLKFEYIENDEDLFRIEKEYIEKREIVIKTILGSLDDQTYGAVFQRQNAIKRDRDKYVAVIDCRGDKRARKFFTKWHEIAHLLTLKRQQLEFAMFRDMGNKKPEEQLMDLIAGRVGFYPDIFKRACQAEYAAYQRVSFGLVQRVRDNVCPDASFEATLNASLEEFPAPCLLAKVEMGLSASEKRSLAEPSLFPDDERPIELLRAVSVRSNKLARERKLTIRPNMRVPVESAVYRAFQLINDSVSFDDAGYAENMEIWKHSDGRTLQSCDVTVHMRPHGKSLLVLIVANPTL